MSDRPPSSSLWCVLRHGGRSTDDWRVVFSGRDELTAREQYAKAALALRQGGVELVSPDNVVTARTIGPRLRTRW